MLAVCAGCPEQPESKARLILVSMLAVRSLVSIQKLSFGADTLHREWYHIPVAIAGHPAAITIPMSDPCRIFLNEC
jgi:hypothetical protein